MRLRPTEHLENRKMHTQERQLTGFLYFRTDLQRKPNRNLVSAHPYLKVTGNTKSQQYN